MKEIGNESTGIDFTDEEFDLLDDKVSLFILIEVLIFLFLFLFD